jgi:catechol-2,3-dioxygenase
VHVQSLGHVVLKVHDSQRSEAFYGGVLGMPVAGRVTDPVPMTFFTLGHHHDFAVMELGQHGPSPDRHTAGLAHVAFKIGDTLDEYDAVKRELEAAGVVILFELDHTTTKGMHMHDPDRNEVELFVDMSPPQQTNP